jgi:uncharacterized protein GlcG (DUF336 family)
MIAALSTLLVLAVVGYVLTSRWHGRPVNPRALRLMPAVLSGYGLLPIAVAAGRGLRAADVILIAAGATVSAAMGVTRAVTVAVSVHDGQPWMRYRLAILAMWAATLATRLAVTAISIATGSSAATRGPAIPLSVGVTLLAEGIVVTRRGFSPHGLQWQARSRQQTLAAR